MKDDASDFDHIGINKDESIYQENSMNNLAVDESEHNLDDLDEIDTITEHMKS